MEDKITITLPKLGESITQATVVKWLKKTGDEVKRDEPLVEVSTDKVNSEIPAPQGGILLEILANEEEEIEVGAPLALLCSRESNLAQEPLKACSRSQSPPIASCTKGKEEIFSPAVLRLAQSEGIPFEKLRTIPGSGEGGRITKKDVENYLSKGVSSPPLVGKPLEERVKMSGLRKTIADNMVRSFYEAPHASIVHEADVTELFDLMAKEKERFQEVHEVKLTFTSFLLQALTKTLQQFPLLNASLEGETIVIKRYINIGVAVHIEGGLIVPVIKNCEERNLVSIAKSLADLSARARAGKLSPDDVTEGTITLTNFGMTGALLGTPIIRYPEVAILGAGAIQKRLVVKDDGTMAIRQMLYLSLTFDHRIIDGIYGCQFLAAFKQHLEAR